MRLLKPGQKDYLGETIQVRTHSEDSDKAKSRESKDHERVNEYNG